MRPCGVEVTTREVKSEDGAVYLIDATANINPKEGDDIIKQAREIILSRFRQGEILITPSDSTNYILQVLLGAKEHEVFGVLMLNNRNQVIAWREMFRGTVDGASVYPREIVKQALADNAAAEFSGASKTPRT